MIPSLFAPNREPRAYETRQSGCLETLQTESQAIAFIIRSFNPTEEAQNPFYARQFSLTILTRRYGETMKRWGRMNTKYLNPNDTYSSKPSNNGKRKWISIPQSTDYGAVRKSWSL
jgi:hypothetical protein